MIVKIIVIVIVIVILIIIIIIIMLYCITFVLRPGGFYRLGALLG